MHKPGILMIVTAMAFGLASASSAQSVRPMPGSSGIGDSSLTTIGGDDTGVGGPVKPGIVSPRQFDAAIQDRVTVQKTLRRRWEAAGPEERKKMLDLQKKLSRSELQNMETVDRKAALDRMRSRARVAASPQELPSRAIAKPSNAIQVPVLSDGQRRALRERVRDLSPEQRQGLRDRITELNALNEVDQSILREQLQQWVNLPKEDRAQLESYRERWESMTPEQQDVLRNRMLRLREMNAEQRQDLLNRTLGDSQND